MRIHTDKIAYTQTIRNALAGQKELGRIASHVTLKTLNHHRSRSHQFAFEIQLEAYVRDNGRRAGNSGSYGAMQPEYDGYAATYDEWGWLLAALYQLDSMMIVGSTRYAVYRNAIDFHTKTALTYNPDELLSILEDEEDPYPWVSGPGSKGQGFVIGRRGANRQAEEPRWNGVRRPRTADEVCSYAFPLEVEA